MGDWFCGLIGIRWKGVLRSPFPLAQKDLEGSGSPANKRPHGGAPDCRGRQLVPDWPGLPTLGRTCWGKKDTLIDQAQILHQALCPALYTQFS